MHWFRSFVTLAAMLTLLASCSFFDSPTPEREQAPAPSQEQEQAQKPEKQEPPQQEAELTRMQPCKVQNVNDDACTSELAKALTDILLENGESQTSASQAGEAIASAIKGAPLDKRNGFTMTGPDTGKRYSFLFQNEDGKAFLVLFRKAEGGDENEYEPITWKAMPSCQCAM